MKKKDVFFRTVRFTSAFLLAALILIYGFSKSYSQLRRIGFGEYKSAVEYTDGTLRIFDFIF